MPDLLDDLATEADLQAVIGKDATGVDGDEDEDEEVNTGDVDTGDDPQEKLSDEDDVDDNHLAAIFNDDKKAPPKDVAALRLLRRRQQEATERLRKEAATKKLNEERTARRAGRASNKEAAAAGGGKPASTGGRDDMPSVDDVQAAADTHRDLTRERHKMLLVAEATRAANEEDLLGSVALVHVTPSEGLAWCVVTKLSVDVYMHETPHKDEETGVEYTTWEESTWNLHMEV